MNQPKRVLQNKWKIKRIKTQRLWVIRRNFSKSQVRQRKNPHPRKITTKNLQMCKISPKVLRSNKILFWKRKKKTNKKKVFSIKIHQMFKNH